MKKKTVQQLGGEAVKKKYGNGHFKKLANKRWEEWRKQNAKRDIKKT